MLLFNLNVKLNRNILIERKFISIILIDITLIPRRDFHVY